MAKVKKGGKPFVAGKKPTSGKKVYRKIKNGFVEPRKAKVAKGQTIAATDIISAADLSESEDEAGEFAPKDDFAKFPKENDETEEVKEKEVKEKEVKNKEVKENQEGKEVKPKVGKDKSVKTDKKPAKAEITKEEDLSDWSNAEFSEGEGDMSDPEAETEAVDIRKMKWKKVDLGDKKMDFEGFYGLEELDGVDVIVENGLPRFVKSKETKKTKKTKETKPAAQDSNKSEEPKKKKAKVVSQQQQQQPKNEDLGFEALQNVPDDIDLPDWTLDGEQLHYSLIQGLYSLGYKSPTEIQKKSIPAILSGDDVIGKASTGSGKTLAYGLPLLHRFLTQQKAVIVDEEPKVKKDKKKVKKVRSEEEEDDEDAHMFDEDVKRKFVDRPEDLPKLDKDKEDRENSVDMEEEEDDDEEELEASKVNPPEAIVFAPTRELAHQIVDHLNSVSKFCPISGPRVMALTGGLSIFKQRRLMKWSPAIIVATPGRFHEFISDTAGMVDVFKKAKTVVLDEADRMLQDGHYEDLDKALDLIGRGRVAKRQTCVFSATFQKSLMYKLDRKRKNQAKNTGLASDTETIRFLVSKMKFRQFQPKFVDANPAEVVARQVIESIVECGAMEKDQYLYYFLLTYPGKSIIFVNSIDSVKRLTPMLQNLELPAVQLHSNMIQKARLRSLERFRDNENGILVATDVAARGLDIPNVHHVVHYHLPRTADVYVHRSGRTARAGNEGVSVLLCSPEEASGPLRKLRTALSKDNALAKLQPLTLNYDVLAQIKPRVKLAKDLADSVLNSTQAGKQSSWLKEAADDLGVDLSDFENDSHDYKGHSRTKKTNKKNDVAMSKYEMDAARAELAQLLKKPLGRHSSKYLTSTNGINLAKMMLDGKSHDKILGVAPTSAEETLRKKRKNK